MVGNCVTLVVTDITHSLKQVLTIINQLTLKLKKGRTMSQNCCYLGPYIKIKVKDITVPVWIHTCTNHECEDHKKYVSDSKFCSVCGAPKDKLEINVKRHFNIMDVLEKHNVENDFYLWNFDDYSVVLPNKRQSGIRIKDDGVYPITNTTVTSSFLHPDWSNIKAIFEEEQIEFEQDIGVVYYYD